MFNSRAPNRQIKASGQIRNESLASKNMKLGKLQKRKTTWEYGTEFEFCMRCVFGDEAYQIAGSCLNDDYRSQWVERFLKKLISNAQELDTTQKHRERISYLLEALKKQNWKGEDASWAIVFDLLATIAELLGYEGVKGHRTYLPMYWQEMQTHLDVGNERGQGEQLQQQFMSAAARRVEILRYLKNQGITDFEVAMAMKTSESEVKKLKKQI
jgi:hypothetical protein